MTKLNKALMATTAIAFASGLAMPASAQDPTAAPGVVKSSKKMKIRLYGQITRGFGWIDDGSSGTFIQFRNGNTSSRMGIDGRGKISKNVSLRTRLEFEIRNGDSNQVTEGQGTDGGPVGTQTDDNGDKVSDAQGALVIRHIDAIFSHKRLGAVWIGRGDTAANGTSEKNLLPGGSTGRLGGRTDSLLTNSVIRDSNDNEIDSLSKFFNSFDGLSRRQRIRYDTPTIAGFKVGVSAIDRMSYDIAVHYSGKIAGVKVKAGAGWSHGAGALGATADRQDFNQLNGSISALLPMGVGVTLSGGRQWEDYFATTPEADRKNPSNINISAFYTTKLSELGPTGVEYSYQLSQDISERDDEGQGHSIMLTQVLANTGTDTFVTFRYYDVERIGEVPEELWFFGAGFRARF